MGASGRILLFDLALRLAYGLPLGTRAVSVSRLNYFVPKKVNL